MAIGVGCKAQEIKDKLDWLPIVDAFRTFATCPPPAVKAAFQEIQSLAVA